MTFLKNSKVNDIIPKKTLLVFALTFPRWRNDTIPPFVYELSKELKQKSLYS